MPLPNDEKLLALANDLIHQLEKLFGEHPGFRPAHAKGAMFTGTFTPAAVASSLTRAPHVLRSSTPVTVRFSNSTGVPLLPDNDPNANPRGLAIRFHLAEHVHTDIVSHSTDGFPTHDSEERASLSSSGSANLLKAHLSPHTTSVDRAAGRTLHRRPGGLRRSLTPAQRSSVTATFVWLTVAPG